MAKAKTLEENFQELDGILGQLERRDISLEESFRLYKDGMKLVKKCNESIDRIEKEIMILSEEEEEQS